MGFGVWGLGFRVEGWLGFGVGYRHLSAEDSGLGFGVQGLRLHVVVAPVAVHITLLVGAKQNTARKTLNPKPSNPQTLKPSNPQTLKPSNPQTLKPSNPQTLKPSTLNPKPEAGTLSRNCILPEAAGGDDGGDWDTEGLCV